MCPQTLNLLYGLILFKDTPAAGQDRPLAIRAGRVRDFSHTSLSVMMDSKTRDLWRRIGSFMIGNWKLGTISTYTYLAKFGKEREIKTARFEF